MTSSRINTEGKLTSTQPMDSLRFSPPEMPLRPAPPTMVSAASESPSSWIVCSTMSFRVAKSTEDGSRNLAAYVNVSRTKARRETGVSNTERCDEKKEKTKMTYRSDVAVDNHSA